MVKLGSWLNESDSEGVISPFYLGISGMSSTSAFASCGWGCCQAMVCWIYIYIYLYIYMDGPLAKVVVDIPTVHGSAEVNGWADHWKDKLPSWNIFFTRSFQLNHEDVGGSVHTALLVLFLILDSWWCNRIVKEVATKWESLETTGLMPWARVLHHK